MTTKRRPEPPGAHEVPDSDLRRALAMLNRPDADEQTLDAALQTLMPLSALPEAPQGFSDRIMQAVRQAPLRPGRVPLTQPRAPWRDVAAVGTASAALAWGAVAVFGSSVAPLLGAAPAFIVQTGVLILNAVLVVFQIWSTTATAGTALGHALASPPLAVTLGITMLVSLLSLAGLTRLLSTEQEPSRWQDNSSLV